MTAVPPTARSIRFQAAIASDGAFVLAAAWEGPPIRVTAATPREAFALARNAAEEAGSDHLGCPAVALPLEPLRYSNGDGPADASFVLIPLAEMTTWLVGRCVSLVPAARASAPTEAPTPMPPRSPGGTVHTLGSDGFSAHCPPSTTDVDQDDTGDRQIGPGPRYDPNTEEPSMDRILDSIRRIISEDPDPSDARPFDAA